MSGPGNYNQQVIEMFRANKGVVRGPNQLILLTTTGAKSGSQRTTPVAYSTDGDKLVIIASKACVAVEAMEGTDAAIERAGLLMRSLDADAPGDASTPHPSDNDSSPGTPTLRRHLTVVKVAKPNQDMRFDVPVIGIHTLETMLRAGASCLSVEAGRTLLFDRESLLRRASQENIAIIAVPRTY